MPSLPVADAKHPPAYKDATRRAVPPAQTLPIDGEVLRFIRPSGAVRDTFTLGEVRLAEPGNFTDATKPPVCQSFTVESRRSVQATQLVGTWLHHKRIDPHSAPVRAWALELAPSLPVELSRLSTRLEVLSCLDASYAGQTAASSKVYVTRRWLDTLLLPNLVRGNPLCAPPKRLVRRSQWTPAVASQLYVVSREALTKAGSCMGFAVPADDNVRPDDSAQATDGASVYVQWAGVPRAYREDGPRRCAIL